MSIQFKNIQCELGGRNILKNISGEIKYGTVTAILGRNGCGKSTFLRALLGLVPLKNGEISGFSKRLGYLPQAKEIYWPLTCEAIMNLGNQNSARDSDIPGRLKIKHLLEKRIDEISGGERTLVLLARALIDRPEILIADEPVSELDPSYQIQVMKILCEEALRGAAVLTTMHDVNLTAQFADQVFLMRDGQIFAEGPVTRVLNQANLEAIFESVFEEKKGFCVADDS